MNRKSENNTYSSLIKKIKLFDSELNRRSFLKEKKNYLRKERLPKDNLSYTKPIKLGDIEVIISDYLDEEREGKKSRKFVFSSKGKPTVTIVDEEPDNLDTEGTVQVLDRTIPIRITHKQINDAYKAAYFKVTSERVRNNKF